MLKEEEENNHQRMVPGTLASSTKWEKFGSTWYKSKNLVVLVLKKGENSGQLIFPIIMYPDYHGEREGTESWKREKV